MGKVKLIEWSVVDELATYTNVEIELDAGSISGRTFKVCTVPKVLTNGKSTNVFMKKSTNYTLTIARLRTPKSATTLG